MIKRYAIAASAAALLVSIAGISALAAGKATPKATGGVTLANPNQQMSFNAFDYGPSDSDRGNVEYSNFDYPGGLHYTATVLCAAVSGSESRFVYQIPDGTGPGLDGLFIVVKVVDGGTPGTNGDTWGFAVAPNISTANSWCDTGDGFVPTSYEITGGNLVVH